MEKALIRGYRHYWNAIDTLPPYMEKNLKEMPNNKGYRWKNVVFYGALPANENHSTIIFEKNPKGLIIHEYKIDGTYNHTIKPFGPKLDNIKNGVNKENNKIKSVKSVKYDKARKNNKQNPNQNTSTNQNFNQNNRQNPTQNNRQNPTQNDKKQNDKNQNDKNQNDKNQTNKKQKYNKNGQNTTKSTVNAKPRRLLLNKNVTPS